MALYRMDLPPDLLSIECRYFFELYTFVFAIFDLHLIRRPTQKNHCELIVVKLFTKALYIFLAQNSRKKFNNLRPESLLDLNVQNFKVETHTHESIAFTI